MHESRIALESPIDRLRARKIAKYRVQWVFYRVISIIAVASAAYFGWASRSLISSSLSVMKQQISSIKL